MEMRNFISSIILEEISKLRNLGEYSFYMADSAVNKETLYSMIQNVEGSVALLNYFDEECRITDFTVTNFDGDINLFEINLIYNEYNGCDVALSPDGKRLFPPAKVILIEKDGITQNLFELYQDEEVYYFVETVNIYSHNQQTDNLQMDLYVNTYYDKEYDVEMDRKTGIHPDIFLNSNEVTRRNRLYSDISVLCSLLDEVKGSLSGQQFHYPANSQMFGICELGYYEYTEIARFHYTIEEEFKLSSEIKISQTFIGKQMKKNHLWLRSYLSEQLGNIERSKVKLKSPPKREMSSVS